MKTGIVLEGGAMRGMFTAGVLDIFIENKVQFDGAIGVSAGAVFGCNLKSLQPGRVIRYNKRFCGNWRYCSLKSWRKTGDLYGADFCYNQLPYRLDPFDIQTYRENPMRFYVVATDAETGKPVYRELERGDGTDMEWFRASASMPVLSRPVMIEGRGYLDGGCSDSIPVKFFESIGYQKNVVLLTQPPGYRKKKSPFLPAVRLMLRRYPALGRDLTERAEVYNAVLDNLEQREKAGDPGLLLIRPSDELNIGKMEKDPEELERVYQIGRETGTRVLERVVEFCGGTGGDGGNDESKRR